MIPKIIHYIWLGGNELPKIAQKCIKSWQKYCPDYEIKRWDESNLKIDKCQYTKESYDSKKFAFTSDYFRFDILYKEGGIYLDIDVELLSSLDSFLDKKGIMCFESQKLLNPGLILACEKNNEDIKNLLDSYKSEKFVKDDGLLNLTTICERATNYFSLKGLKLNNTCQIINDFHFYSTEYFCPKSLTDGKIRKTENTVAIHHYFGSWISKPQKIKNCILQFIKRIMGQKLVNKLKEKKYESSASSRKQ